MIEQLSQMSPREVQEHDWRVTEFEKSAVHAKEMKLLDLEVLREQNAAKIELKKLEAKWATWLRIPIIIIKLPILLMFSIAYIVSVITKKEMPKHYWDLLS